MDWPENEATDGKMFIDFLVDVNRKYQAYFREASQANQLLSCQIVVHGEKGVGRTAAYCVADICLYQVIYTASISVPLTVINMR